MVSAFTHATVAVALGTLLPRQRLPRRAWLPGACLSVVPDLDCFLRWSGRFAFDSPWNHRGFTHSLAFAAALAGAVTAVVAWRRWPGARAWWFAYLFVCTASHGLLDALTNGGTGIAFFWPFTDRRWFLPWGPIEVAPISVRGFFTAHGWDVFTSELCWVWLPAWTIALGAAIVRRARRSDTK